MSDKNKDELLKQQQEEINKLKKELREATRPSSLISVVKNSFKRNMREIIDREEKIKRLNSEIMKLEKELEKAKEENDINDAINFAEQDLNSQDENLTEEEIEELNLPRTKEEAIKKFFKPIDFEDFAKKYVEKYGDRFVIVAEQQHEEQPLHETQPTATLPDDMPRPHEGRHSPLTKRTEEKINRMHENNETRRRYGTDMPSSSDELQNPEERIKTRTVPTRPMRPSEMYSRNSVKTIIHKEEKPGFVDIMRQLVKNVPEDSASGYVSDSKTNKEESRENDIEIKPAESQNNSQNTETEKEQQKDININAELTAGSTSSEKPKEEPDNSQLSHDSDIPSLDEQSEKSETEASFTASSRDVQKKQAQTSSNKNITRKKKGKPVQKTENNTVTNNTSSPDNSQKPELASVQEASDTEKSVLLDDSAADSVTDNKTNSESLAHASGQKKRKTDKRVTKSTSSDNVEQKPEKETQKQNENNSIIKTESDKQQNQDIQKTQTVVNQEQKKNMPKRGFNMMLTTPIEEELPQPTADIVEIDDIPDLTDDISKFLFDDDDSGDFDDSML